MTEPDLGRMIYRDVDPTLLMQRIVEQASRLVDRCDGVAILTSGGGELRTVCATGVSLEHVGGTLPIDGSLSGLAVLRGELLHSADIRIDDRVDPRMRVAPGRSMLAVPLRHGSEVIGVLVLVSSLPAAFDTAARATVARVAGFVGVALGSLRATAGAARDLLESLEEPVAVPQDDGRPEPRWGHGERVGEFLANVLKPGSVDRLRIRQRVAAVLRDARLRVVGQPIVDVETGRLFGVEALARVAGEPYRSPDVWIGEAHDVGVGLELESLALERAFHLLDDLPDGALLGVNVSHELLVSGRVRELLADCPGERVMLELTEHTAFEDYTAFRDAMSELSQRGVRLAVDDVGAGYSSFRHVVELAPDCIKLDRLFTHGIENDPARRAMAEALITFARATNINLVAEGIETERQLEVVRELGIRLGQGYLIARPSDGYELDPGFEALLRRRQDEASSRGQAFARYGKRFARHRTEPEPEPEVEPLNVL